MTNLEALRAELVDLIVDDILIAKVLTDNEVVGDSVYSSTTGKKSIDLCKRDILLKLAAMPEIKEGGFSIKYDRGGLIALARAIERTYDIEPANIDGTPLW